MLGKPRGDHVWLLRVSLGRPNAVELYGPPGILAQVEAKLAAYTWNLVHNYAGNFTLEVGELWPDGRLERAKFACRERFRREAAEPRTDTGGVLIDTGGFRVRAVLLDHEVPVLGFLLEEHAHVNLWKNRLGEMGLVVGPWLQKLKRAVISGLDDDTPIRATGAGGGEATLTLGELRPALRVVPGTRIAYVTDVVDHEENARRIARLADRADVLYIEAVFLDADAAHATRKFHLTARQAGRIARAAGVRSVVPFHFSPRYAGREAELREELQRAFAGD